MTRHRHQIPAARWPSSEEAAGSLLVSPNAVGRSCELSSRTWVPAMVPWRATEDGFVTQDVIDWYGRFADGRPGALVVEATGIRDVPSGPLLRVGDDRFLPGLRELVAEVRRRSGGATRVFLQVIDFLAIRRRPPPGAYFRRFLDVRREHAGRLAAHLGEDRWRTASDDEVRERLVALDDAGHEAVLSSREVESLRMGHRERVTDLHLPHVRDLPRTLPPLFAASAARAESAGFDGVELHYAHAYTMASLLSRLNDRTDGYGGSPEARVRLPLEVFRAVRDRVGPDFVVGCRFLGDEVVPGGGCVEDACFHARKFAAAGMDFLSVSKGGKFEDARRPRVGEAAYPYTGPSGQACMPTVHLPDLPPFGRNLPLSAAVRRAVRQSGHATPVVAAGGLNSFEICEEALRSGAADIVAAARQSLADPDWWQKMRTGQGAAIRRCLYTNYCEALDQKHRQVTCQLWDRTFTDADGPDVRRSHDGRRRLVPPRWDRGDGAPADGEF